MIVRVVFFFLQSLHEEEEVLEELNLFLDLLVAYKVSWRKREMFVNSCHRLPICKYKGHLSRLYT